MHRVHQGFAEHRSRGAGLRCPQERPGQARPGGAAALLSAAVLAAVVLSGLPQACGGYTPPTDAELLLAMKDSFDSGATVLADWVPGGQPCGAPAWTGVTCDDAGRVTEM